MGQTVGGYTKDRRRDSFSSCVSSCDSSVGSLEENSKSQQDDVTTPQSLFPYTTYAKSPSNSDEPSMSSSIIETNLVKEESRKANQNVAGLASKIIPKRAWSGYHLFQLANMRGERINNSTRVIRSPKIRPKLNNIDSTNTVLEENTGEEDIDQLITMMKNHKVSDDSPFDFNFKNTKPLTPQPSPQPIPATTTQSFIPSPEFKFSFSANIPTTTTNEPNYIKVREIYREVDGDDDEDEEDEEEEQKQVPEQKRYDPHLNHRKILPLPKPRLKKSTHIPLPNSTLINNNNNNSNTLLDTNLNRDITTTDTNMDRDDSNKKKLKSSSLEEQKPDNNKRKERNWKDNFTLHTTTSPPPPPPIPSTTITTTTTTTTTTAGIELNTQDKKMIKKPLPITEKKSSTTTIKKKKGKLLLDDITITKPNKNKQKTKKKNKEEIAPGGFLSSDINLFENPISDDWICLFCQYDILFNGLQDARKKNGYYRRKKERSRRARETELRRMGSLCYSDVDHDH